VKLFHLYRVSDPSGVSGTGPVVEGVEFTNGWCALRWVTGSSTLCFYPSLAEVEAIHGHGGRTELIVHDFEPLSRPRSAASGARFELLLELIEEASRATLFSEDPKDLELALRSLERVRALVSELEASLMSGPKAA
jgi:hypothetical protein